MLELAWELRLVSELILKYCNILITLCLFKYNLQYKIFLFTQVIIFKICTFFPLAQAYTWIISFGAHR